MADVTYYVAMPFLQDDSGTPVAGAAEECQSPTTALRRAETMSRMAGSIGAVAFSRSGDPMMGEFGDAKLLRKFGNVPDDLSGLYPRHCERSEAIHFSFVGRWIASLRSQ
jgi:hypothetical protein